MTAKSGKIALESSSATPSQYFPPPESSTPDGLVSIGGDLTVERLLDAYRHGIFPWPVYEDDPMLWWSPDPRAILPLDGMYISRRVERRIRSGEFTLTCDNAFEKVIRSCSSGPGRQGGTWLTPEMIDAYVNLHRHGHAHSVEAWKAGELVGGTYGVAIGGLFAAESMFYRATDASKVALAALVGHLNARGFALLDVQQWTPHTGTLGVREIPRELSIWHSDWQRQSNLPVSFGKELASSSARDLKEVSSPTDHSLGGAMGLRRHQWPQVLMAKFERLAPHLDIAFELFVFHLYANRAVVANLGERG